MSGAHVARSIRLARRQIGKPIGARMRARNNARIYGCIGRRRLGSGDNGKGSICTSNDSVNEDPDDREEEEVKRQES
jgi:hypothetical protein